MDGVWNLLLHNGTPAFQPVHQPCWERVSCGRVSQGKQAGFALFAFCFPPSLPTKAQVQLELTRKPSTSGSLVRVRASAVLEMFVQHHLFCSLNFNM